MILWINAHYILFHVFPIFACTPIPGQTNLNIDWRRPFLRCSWNCWWLAVSALGSSWCFIDFACSVFFFLTLNVKVGTLTDHHPFPSNLDTQTAKKPRKFRLMRTDLGWDILLQTVIMFDALRPFDFSTPEKKFPIISQKDLASENNFPQFRAFDRETPVSQGVSHVFDVWPRSASWDCGTHEPCTPFQRHQSTKETTSSNNENTRHNQHQPTTIRNKQIQTKQCSIVQY